MNRLSRPRAPSCTLAARPKPMRRPGRLANRCPIDRVSRPRSERAGSPAAPRLRHQGGGGACGLRAARGRGDLLDGRSGLDAGRRASQERTARGDLRHAQRRDAPGWGVDPVSGVAGTLARRRTWLRAGRRRDRHHRTRPRDLGGPDDIGPTWSTGASLEWRETAWYLSSARSTFSRAQTGDLRMGKDDLARILKEKLEYRSNGNRS